MQIQTLGRCLKEQLTNGLDDDGMMVEIIWEITSVVETSLVTSVQVLALARRVGSPDDPNHNARQFKRTPGILMQ